MTSDLSIRPLKGPSPDGPGRVDPAAPKQVDDGFRAILKRLARDADPRAVPHDEEALAPEAAHNGQPPADPTASFESLEDGPLIDLPDWLRMALQTVHDDGSAQSFEVDLKLGDAQASAEVAIDLNGLHTKAPDHASETSIHSVGFVVQSEVEIDASSAGILTIPSSVGRSEVPTTNIPADPVRLPQKQNAASSDPIAIVARGQSVNPSSVVGQLESAAGKMALSSGASRRPDQSHATPVVHGRADADHTSTDPSGSKANNTAENQLDALPVRNAAIRTPTINALDLKAGQNFGSPDKPGLEHNTNRIQSILPTPIPRRPIPSVEAPMTQTITLSPLNPAAMNVAAPASMPVSDFRAPPPVPLTQLPEAISAHVKTLTTGDSTPATLRSADGTLSTEMTLAPAELGRLRMTLQTTERGLHLAITVERPESLLAVRQHLESFHRSLIADGVTLASVDIGTGGRGDGFDRHAQRPPNSGRQETHHDDARDSDPSITPHPPGRQAEPGRLDLSF